MVAATYFISWISCFDQLKVRTRLKTKMKIYVGSILQINHTSYISFPNCIRWTALLKAVQNFWDERNCNIHSMILTVKISLKKVVIMLGNGDECMTWMMPWMNYEQLFPTHIPPQWENCPRSPRSSWPKITSWCKEMHWKNSEDLSPICHKWPVSADIHTLSQFKAKYELVWFMRPINKLLEENINQSWDATWIWILSITNYEF